jgi:hypothetical protein
VDEPVPLRRAAVGCLLLAVAAVAVLLVVRPAIFSLAPPRDDGAVAVATQTEVRGGPLRRDVVLSRSRGWAGEREAGDGRVQVTVIVSPTTVGGFAAVIAAAPDDDDCGVDIGADRLTDCVGRAWTLDGVPLDPGDPPLQRVPVDIDNGSITLDLSGEAPQ